MAFDFLRRRWRALFPPKDAPQTDASSLLRNWNAEAARAEFKRRFMPEFARYVAEDMVTNHNAAISFATLAAVLGGSMLGGPVAVLLGGALAARHIMIKRDMGAALIAAGRSLRRELETGGTAHLAAVETWLDGHEQDLPAYLDKLDRAEDELRTVRRIIERVNRAGSPDGLAKDERRLLARHGYRRLTPPIQTTLRLPPRTELGNWHHAQLSRSLWRDVTRTAGDRGRPLRRIFGLARIKGVSRRTSS
jgi:hypothetical protein